MKRIGLQINNWNWQKLLLIGGGGFVGMTGIAIICLLLLDNRAPALVAIVAMAMSAGIGFAYLYFALFLPLAGRLHWHGSRLAKDRWGTTLPNIATLESKIDSFKNSLSQLSEETTHLRQAKQNLEAEHGILTGVKAQLIEEKEQVIEHEATLQSMFRLILDQIEVGVLFVDSRGIIQPEYSQFLHQLLGNASLAGAEMISRFFALQPNAPEAIKLAQWLQESLGASSEKWQRLPIPVAMLTLKKQERTRLQDVYLHLDFVPIIANNHVNQLMVLVYDITREKELEKKLAKTKAKGRSNIDYAVELVKLDTGLLRNFLREAEHKSKIFDEKLQLLQQGTLNRAVIGDLFTCIEEIKNNAHLLKLKGIAQEAGKIQTLLEILRNSRGDYRLEQIVEISERTTQFIELLGQYQGIGKRMVGTASHTEKKSATAAKQEAGDQRQRSSMHKFDRFWRMALSASAYPIDIIKSVLQEQELKQQLLPESGAQPLQVFELHDILQRLLDSLRQAFAIRQITIQLATIDSPILLHGDLLQIIKLLTMFIQASLWRGEETSTLKIQSQLVAAPEQQAADILKLQSSVAIRNTDEHAIEKMQRCYKNAQIYCQRCGGQIAGSKRGFSLQLPLVVNKRFSVIRIGWLGGRYDELQKVVTNIAPVFPGELQIVPGPTDYGNLALLLVEAKTLATLAEHINNKLKQHQSLPLVAVMNQEEAVMYDDLLKLGAIDGLIAPLAAGELKWCLLQCLDHMLVDG